MAGTVYRDISAFLTVAQERSFTRAAAKLGVSQPALSHTIRTLETRLGIRLLTRTTRSVSPTEAGQRLIQRVAPRLRMIDDELAAFNERGDTGGTVHLSTPDYAMKALLWPKLAELRSASPDIRLEITVEPEPVGEHYDAAIRFGVNVARNLAAVRIAPDIKMAMVAAPAYLATRPAPLAPSDLTQHECILLRIAPQNKAHIWELRNKDETVLVHVNGPWEFNCIDPVVNAALAGAGLAYLPEDSARPYLASGALQPVLKGWWITLPGLHLVYDNRAQLSSALMRVVEALRYR
ncbi:LysR family transcriptional regulator [Franconibacter helveticus 513]|uniref:LysR family transcriptional regulator n=1 Tax=Franconibacter helveticus TaxID=357240 RepID=UPI0003F77F57|nr:LysR family transcriptional regulator [Franconibacter helveticus]